MTTHDPRANRPVYRIEFNPGTDMGSVEDTLLTAILSVGCLHGQAAVRLETGYAIDADAGVVVLDAEAPLGIAVARVFVGMCSHEYGDDAFRVTRGEASASRELVGSS